MPTYTVSLAYDVTYYGLVSVEGDTWQEAVASLTLADWDECYEQSDHGWEQRVVRVEAEDSGDIVAEDINFNCAMVHYMPIIHRLTTIMDTCDVPDDTAAALVAYIDELGIMVQDPIFEKGDE
jgi:hypothetical protein